jgi:hypothetical protein
MELDRHSNARISEVRILLAAHMANEKPWKRLASTRD